MIRRVIVRPLALADIADAAAWYEAQHPSLGEELVDEIIRAIRRAEANPDLFRIIRPRGAIRRVLTQRFPYRIFFSVNDDTLHVHAVLHSARQERHWKDRL